MGIREEIEKLRRPSLLGSQCQQEYDWLGRQVYNALQVEGDTIIDQVLSIFDEWGLVVEYDAPVDVGLHIIGKCDNYADVGLSLDFEEGDHIAIYVRRGKEDE